MRLTFATEGSTCGKRLQQGVAFGMPTGGSVTPMGWGDYWREVCAPKLLRRKEELGRKMPEREIAAAVEAATGKPSARGLVWMWLHGEREPFISQFFALCEKLGLDPHQVLRKDRTSFVGDSELVPEEHSTLKNIPLRKRTTKRRKN
jgi:hypothetical protein